MLDCGGGSSRWCLSGRRRRPAGGRRGKSLPKFGGKHGAARNLQVLHRRRAPHRAGHACRPTILPTMAFVHAVPARQARLIRSQAVCSCAPGAATRRSCAVAATAARCTAPVAVPKQARQRTVQAGRAALPGEPSWPPHACCPMSRWRAKLAKGSDGAAVGASEAATESDASRFTRTGQR